MLYRNGYNFIEELIQNRTLDNGLYSTLIWADKCLRDIKRINRNRYTMYMIGCNDALTQFLSRHMVKVVHV